jgi:hypothetical protein
MVLDTPEAAWRLWKSLGATHVLWWPDRGDMAAEELAREAVFARTVASYGASPESIGDKRLSKLGRGPAALGQGSTPWSVASGQQATVIAWLGCGADPVTGLYTPRGLVGRAPAQTLTPARLREAPNDALAHANALVWRPSCPELAATRSAIMRGFTEVIHAGGVGLWIRR